jgi:pimeloyl-ACP methyl ester carboxylesterase
MIMETIKRIKLSYREKPVGGEVMAFPKILPENEERALAEAKHLVLLIHGYNNDETAAHKAYEGFYARQCDLDPNMRYGIGRTFVDIYWPGDAAWGFVSFLFYMGSIKHSIQTAQRLAAYLTGHIGNTTRIDIVAHSMGCRFGLELLRTLSGSTSAPNIRRIVFMAGAVPTFMLEQRTPPRRLRPAYDDVLCEGARSLYSGSDMVLSVAFPAGQSLAPGPEGFLPTALGHTIWSAPSVPLNLGQEENPKSRHGDYWGWNTKPGPLHRAKIAAKEISTYLQFPSAGSRFISDRPISEHTVPEPRPLALNRVTIKRDIALRT